MASPQASAPDLARRRRPSPLRRAAKVLAGTVVVLALVWLGGLVYFAHSIPRAVQDLVTPTDAIVVLTGGSERLDEGLRLLREGRARKVLVSGVYHRVDKNELLRVTDGTAEEVECCVILGYSAGDTVGNAVETAEWMAAEGFRSLRLVTANYHMPRSLLEFRRALPGAEVVPHPVFPAGFKSDEWWRWRGTANLMVSEYLKYLAALARSWIAAPPGIVAPPATPSRDVAPAADPPPAPEAAAAS